MDTITVVSFSWAVLRPRSSSDGWSRLSRASTSRKNGGRAVVGSAVTAPNHSDAVTVARCITGSFQVAR